MIPFLKLHHVEEYGDTASCFSCEDYEYLKEARIHAPWSVPQLGGCKHWSHAFEIPKYGTKNFKGRSIDTFFMDTFFMVDTVDTHRLHSHASIQTALPGGGAVTIWDSKAEHCGRGTEGWL